MPTRVHVFDGERDWTLEVSGNEVWFVDDGTTHSVRRDASGRLHADEVRGAAVRSGDIVWVTVDGALFAFTVGQHAGRRALIDSGALAPPMPATVVRVAVTPGQPVRQGDLLIALEAMKMELPIRAPRDGVVRAIHCREGELVQAGQQLVEL